MDYLEKGSPVRQNIRQDVYNSTNFVGRVDVDAIKTEVQQILEDKKSKTGTVILSSSLNKI